MKISDFPAVQTLRPNDMFLLDGPDGTKTITVYDLEKVLRPPITFDAFISMIDDYGSIEQRRTTFRGKNLGDSFTKEQAKNIVNGTFKGFFVGDYWEKGENIWRIGDFNYWATDDPHLLIIPDNCLPRTIFHRIMNSGVQDSEMPGTGNTGKGTTEGAYYNSLGRQTLYDERSPLSSPMAIIKSFFNYDDILQNKEYLHDATTDGYASHGQRYDSTIELPNEPMMFGSYIFTPGGNGTVTVDRRTTSMSQLALMKLDPKWIYIFSELGNRGMWLRDVVNDQCFALIDGVSKSPSFVKSNYNQSVPGTAYGFRPVFGVTGKALASQ